MPETQRCAACKRPLSRYNPDPLCSSCLRAARYGPDGAEAPADVHSRVRPGRERQYLDRHIRPGRDACQYGKPAGGRVHRQAAVVAQAHGLTDQAPRAHRGAGL